MVRVTAAKKAKTYKTIYGAFRGVYGKNMELRELLDPVKVTIGHGKGVRGVAGDCRNCTMSQAACQQNRYDDAFTSGRKCILVKDGVAYQGMLSSESKALVQFFDETGQLEPGEYVIRPIIRRPSRPPTHAHGPRKTAYTPNKAYARPTVVYHPKPQDYEIPATSAVNA